VQSDIVGSYELLTELDRGGMATVSVARHIRLGHAVAIKFLLPQFHQDTTLRARFLDEARIQANLHHPHILAVQDIIEMPDRSGMVMELLSGCTLSAFLRDRKCPMTSSQVVSLFLPLLDALAHAHEAGVIHRDLKPSNVFLHRSGLSLVPKLMDFGIAKLKAVTLEAQLTSAGSVLGTPHYMAPEQFEDSSKVDQRADIYSLGSVMFECLSGVRLAKGQTLVEILKDTISGSRPRLADVAPDADPELAQVVERCLEVNREDRFQSARELQRTLAATERRLGPCPLLAEEVPETDLSSRGVDLKTPITSSAGTRPGTGTVPPLHTPVLGNLRPPTAPGSLRPPTSPSGSGVPSFPMSGPAVTPVFAPPMSQEAFENQPTLATRTDSDGSVSAEELQGAKRSGRGWILWAVAGAVVVAGIAGFLLWPRSEAAKRSGEKPAVSVTPEGPTVDSSAISPKADPAAVPGTEEPKAEETYRSLPDLPALVLVSGCQLTSPDWRVRRAEGLRRCLLERGDWSFCDSRALTADYGVQPTDIERWAAAKESRDPVVILLDKWVHEMTEPFLSREAPLAPLAPLANLVQGGQVIQDLSSYFGTRSALRVWPDRTLEGHISPPAYVSKVERDHLRDAVLQHNGLTDAVYKDQQKRFAESPDASLIRAELAARSICLLLGAVKQ
jgi:serine/threonine-protein kinase